MIERVVTRRRLRDRDGADPAYWLSRPPVERLAHVEALRAGHPRFTEDLDVWIWIDRGNAARLIAALSDFGFGALGLTSSSTSGPPAVRRISRCRGTESRRRTGRLDVGSRG